MKCVFPSVSSIFRVLEVAVDCVASRNFLIVVHRFLCCSSNFLVEIIPTARNRRCVNFLQFFNSQSLFESHRYHRITSYSVSYCLRFVFSFLNKYHNRRIEMFFSCSVLHWLCGSCDVLSTLLLLRCIHMMSFRTLMARFNRFSVFSLGVP